LRSDSLRSNSLSTTISLGCSSTCGAIGSGTLHAWRIACLVLSSDIIWRLDIALARALLHPRVICLHSLVVVGWVAHSCCWCVPKKNNLGLCVLLKTGYLFSLLDKIQMLSNQSTKLFTIYDQF
jgi:hypothetical protein